jgi:hypothetical protein
VRTEMGRRPEGGNPPAVFPRIPWEGFAMREGCGKAPESMELGPLPRHGLRGGHAALRRFGAEATFTISAGINSSRATGFPTSCPIWTIRAQWRIGTRSPNPFGGSYVQRWTAVRSRPRKSATALLPPSRFTISDAGVIG